MQTPYELMGSSPRVREALAHVATVAADERGVLITAEPGLDAERVARAIHARSGRCNAPFLPFACDGAAPAQLERALFGNQHRGGAAELEVVNGTAALARVAGGVLFLPNVTEVPAPLQRRLARLLRDGEARMPKHPRAVPFEVRVIAASAGPADGTLRADLLRRLPLTVDVPPLRRRREDVPAIAEQMAAARQQPRRFTPAALTVLAALPWRRNTAELEALVDRLTSGTTAVIQQEDVLAELQLDRTPLRAAGSLRDARRQFERDYIASVLRDHAWQMRDAARALGIERANLYRKARQLGIPLRPEGDAPGLAR
jgi:DNA-binding NtrC family response regulator